MEFRNIFETLKLLKLDALYLDKFKENNIGDAMAESCMGKAYLINNLLANLIPDENHRSSFISAFTQKLTKTRSKIETAGCSEPPPASVNGPSSNEIKAAVNMACKFYQDEVKKEMSTKEYVSDFQKLSNRITAEAIKSSKKEFNLSDSLDAELTKGLKAVQRKYNEKNLMRAPQDENSLAVGIDLGTTYSCVSVCTNGKVTVIPNELGQPTTPSCVAFHQDGTVDVGEMAKYGTHDDPRDTVFDAKRLIGRKYTDQQVQGNIGNWPFKVVKDRQNDTPKIQIHGKTYHAEEISARVLRHMKKRAEDHLGVKISDAVVTVPAYFNNGQRQATKDAGEIAGLNILKIINEPTAAAIAYKLHRKDELKRNVLIFDLGGGTFDVAVLTICDGEIVVRAVGGDTNLGGQDFDNELVNHCVKIFNEKHNTDLGKVSSPLSSKAIRRIRNECEKQKCFLSSGSNAVISLDMVYQGHDLNVPITRDQFEMLNAGRFEKCITIVEKVLIDAGSSTQEINDIVLVGGSTRIPKIQKMLSDLFGGKTLSKSLNPDEAVAQGAAIQAFLLNGQRTSCDVGSPTQITKIKDVIPFSIGVEILGERQAIVIRKNCVIPCKYDDLFKTVRDNQTEVNFKIFEGEDPSTLHNHLLGKFILENIPPALAGVEDLLVTMDINDEGILHVTAVVKSNRSFGSVTISALQGRLSKERIAELKLGMK